MVLATVSNVGQLVPCSYTECQTTLTLGIAYFGDGWVELQKYRSLECLGHVRAVTRLSCWPPGSEVGTEGSG